jgi:hypothetical protein
LVALVTADLPNLTSREDLMPRQFAALGLARAARVVGGVLYLYDGGYADLAEAHVRSVIEIYALSLYTLFGGVDAYEHVRGSHVRDVGLLPETPELAAAGSLGERWSGPTGKVKWEQLIKSVLPEIVPDGQTENGRKWFTWLYDLAYRGYSMNGVHASVLSIARHLVRRDGFVGVEEGRYEPDDGTRHLVMAGSLLGNLAMNVYSQFSLDPIGPERLMARINFNLTSDDLVIEGEWDGEDSE